MSQRNTWTEEETILAFYYYCQIPFGKIHKTNQTVIRIAELINRTPSAVVFKLGNLGHFDPVLQERNVRGLSNASKLDKEIFLRFKDDWETLAEQAKHIEAKFMHKPIEEIINIDIASLPEGKTRESIVKARINQDFFRNAVLNAYDYTCCITGIRVPELLIASHIKPWAVCDHKTERTNPCNGLCLNALHDKAFDAGLLTVLPDYTIRISSKLAQDDPQAKWFRSFNHERIQLPHMFQPDREYLLYHNDVVFKS